MSTPANNSSQPSDWPFKSTHSPSAPSPRQTGSMHPVPLIMYTCLAERSGSISMLHTEYLNIKCIYHLHTVMFCTHLAVTVEDSKQNLTKSSAVRNMLYDKEKRPRKYLSKWEKDFPWLRYDSVLNRYDVL